jgi:tektin-4
MTAWLSRDSTQVDPMLAVSNGARSGLSTVGFRTAKSTPAEWQTNNYANYKQSTMDRSNSEQMRNDSLRLIKETNALTDKNETESTKKLAERLHDVHFWKSELNREIKDVLDETELLCQQKRRLENALLATEVPLFLASDNLECRQRRFGVDKVEDDVEHQLLREVQLINNVQDLLKRTIQQADKQIA